MESKHTKGDWTIHETGFIFSQKAIICQMNQSMWESLFDDLNQEIKANAKLIVAAPDMLEALKSVRSLNLHLLEEGTVGNRVYLEVQAAIEKATLKS